MIAYPRNSKELAQAGLVAIAFAAVGIVTLSLPTTDFALSRMIWLPSGIALAGLMLGGLRLWPAVFVGAAVTTWATGGAPIHMLGTATANTFEAVLAVWLFHRWGLHRQLESRRELFVFLTVLIVVAALAAAVSVGSLALSGASTGLRIWLMWWLTHVMGGVVLTPLLLSMPTVAGPIARMSAGEAFFLSFGLGATLTLSFTALTPEFLRGEPLAFLSFPFLFWAAYRCGQFGASTASLAAAAFAVTGTLMGAGPFVHESANTSLFLTLVFVSGVEFTTLFVAGVVVERRTAERDREELERRLHRSEKLESLGALAGGIAHDFNNLLVAIAGNVDLVLMDTDEDDPNFRPLRESARASVRAAELCRQLLGYAGQGPFEQAVVDLSGVVGDMTELLPVTVPKGTSVEYDLEVQSLPVRADSNQLRQVLVNLFSNAGDALLGREGRIRISTRFLSAAAAEFTNGVALLDPPDGPCAMLQVQDDGEGIAPENLERMFQPVFSTRGSGRGIGLAAILGILRRHDGAIHVSSTLGQGSTFTIFLPLAELPLEVALPTPPARPFTHGGTVLIVDDEQQVREAASLLVRRLGFDTVHAVDGNSALAELERHPGPISWILLDVTMPGMDGLLALQQIRERGWDVPVLLSSGYVRQPHEIGEELYPARFLPKPYTLALLHTAVEDLLRFASQPDRHRA